MAKIDCSTVVCFVREANRLCEMYEDCGKCPFSGRKKCPIAVLVYDDPDVQSVVDALQEWSDEHPVKTRLDDLLGKYPKYRFYENDRCPTSHPAVFGYCNACAECINKKQTLRYCWDEPLEGGATGKAVE